MLPRPLLPLAAMLAAAVVVAARVADLDIVAVPDLDGSTLLRRSTRLDAHGAPESPRPGEKRQRHRVNELESVHGLRSPVAFTSQRRPTICIDTGSRSSDGPANPRRATPQAGCTALGQVLA